jgi:hypothetical protein
MNKLLLPLLLLWFSITAEAQAPTFELVNTPAYGQTLEVYSFTAPASNPCTGANCVWDISTVPNQLIGQYTISDPALSACAGVNNDGTHTITIQAGASTKTILLGLTATEVSNLAEDCGTANEVIYTDYKKAFEFNWAFNTSFTDNYQEQGGSPSSVTRTYASYGQVITPFGTYNNVIHISSSNGHEQWYNTSPIFPIVDIDGSTVLLYKPIYVTPPAAPSNLSANPVPKTETNNGIILTWQDNSNNEQGFFIQRKDSVNGWFVTIDSVAADVSSYTDNSNLADNALYEYQVAAYNPMGYLISNQSSATTVIASVGILENKARMFVFNNQLTIQNGEQAEMRLVDITGREMMKAKVVADRQVFDVSMLPPGMYIVMIGNSQGIDATTIIKQ